MRGERRGMALVLMLLILLALTALGHGTLLLARREILTARSFHHAVRAGQAAQAAILAGVEAWEIVAAEGPPGIEIPLSSGETDGGLRYGSLLRWLDREFFVVLGRGGSRGWGGERRLAWVGWRLHPGARLGALAGGLELGGAATLEVGGGVDSSDFLTPPEGWSEVCEPFDPVLDSIFSGKSLPPVAPLQPFLLPDSGPGAGIPSLGLLSGTLLLESADEGPEILGRFDPFSWGCPGGAGSGFLASGEDLSLDRGQTCGLLVAAGDLKLGEGARFQGMALVGGTLSVGRGAVFEGMARVGMGLRVWGGGLVRVRACPAIWALEGASRLRVPLVPVSGGIISGY